MSIEFEDHLITLTDEEYDALIQERIARLNTEQQKIVQAREVQRKYYQGLIAKACNPDTSPDDQEGIQNALRDVPDGCEHDRSYCKHCFACGEIDHLMFPEIFDTNGFRTGPIDDRDEPKDD